jgi:hypothetical protein
MVPIEIRNRSADERATADLFVVVGITRRAQALTWSPVPVSLLARCLGAHGFALADAEQERNDSRCGNAESAARPGIEA